MPIKKQDDRAPFDAPAKILSLWNAVKSSKTQLRLGTNKQIFDRISAYVMNSATDAEFLAQLNLDFPAFCAFHIEADGVPLFLAPWQQELSQTLENNKHVLCYAARRMGKTTLFAAKVIYRAVTQDNSIISMFAPSEKQDRCYQEVRRQFTRNPFLYDKFVRGHTFNTEKIELSNGSMIENFTVDLQRQGRLLRGAGGSVLVDEISLIPKRTLTSVIFPMISDAYKNNQIWLTGTPSLDMNAELDTMTEDWKKDPAWAVMMGEMTDWRRGIREGILDPADTMTIMKNQGPDEITMEYEAKFPIQEGRFFPMYLVASCFPDAANYQLLELPDLTPMVGSYLIMAVDWARVMDRTEILVGEIHDGKIKYVFWKRLDPTKDNMDPNAQVRLVQDIYRRLGCSLLIPDATSHQDLLLGMLMKGTHPIPEYSIWRNAKDEMGYRASDDSNHQMWHNHRRMMMNNFIIGPYDKSHNLSHVFMSEFKRQHNSLNVKHTAGSKNLLRLIEPRGGFKDLAVCAAMLSLAAENSIHPPWMSLEKFGGREGAAGAPPFDLDQYLNLIGDDKKSQSDDIEDVW